MSTISASLPTSPLLSGDATPKPKDAAEAAKQFEALMLAQLLRMSRENTDDSLSGEKDSTGDTMWDVAAQQFSQMMAKNGGIGLAKMVTEHLL